jgi:hypothetical protein
MVCTFWEVTVTIMGDSGKSFPSLAAHFVRATDCGFFKIDPDQAPIKVLGVAF